MNTFQEIPANKKSLSRRKLICGIGINDAMYIVQPTINGIKYCCPYYQVWVSMLKRCYSEKYQQKQPTYNGCTVCGEWILFSNFKTWMETQDWVGNELDKDLLFRGNKLYSPDTCIFVPSRINCLLSDSKTIRGLYNQGVSRYGQNGMFRATCKNGSGKAIHLGCYSTEAEALKVYNMFKRNLILELANEQIELKLKNALVYVANTEFKS